MEKATEIPGSSTKRNPGDSLSLPISSKEADDAFKGTTGRHYHQASYAICSHKNVTDGGSLPGILLEMRMHFAKQLLTESVLWVLFVIDKWHLTPLVSQFSTVPSQMKESTIFIQMLKKLGLIFL